MRIGFRGAGELRNVARYAGGEFDLTLLAQDHGCCGGDDWLGERGDVVDRIAERGRGFGFAGELPERMYQELIARADGEYAAGKGALGYGSVEHFESGPETFLDRARGGGECHRFGGERDAFTAPDDARNRDRNFARDGDFSEDRTRCGGLRHAIGAEVGEPRLRRGKAFDQIGAAEGGDDNGFARGEKAVYEGALIFGKCDVAFAVCNAHEDCGDGEVIGFGRRQRQRGNGTELRIRAQSDERIHAPADCGFEGFGRKRVRVRGKGEQQDTERPARIERKDMSVIAKEGRAAIGNALRIRGEFGPGERLVQAGNVDKALAMQAEAAFGRENAAHRIVYSRFWN